MQEKNKQTANLKDIRYFEKQQNPHIPEAETSKCLAFLLDKMQERLRGREPVNTVRWTGREMRQSERQRVYLL